jgi:tRNA (guanosine-2'-O-)-methyltransferase
VREMGYQVVATHLSPNAVDISSVDWTRPTAVVLGNEKEGTPGRV